jgi:peptidoglycan/LPS O-acetylase OafA/YrhL
MRGHVKYLDGWRGIAIIVVLLGHFLRPYTQFILLARLGVDLFFVLSGLLMARILFEQGTPIGTFYRRRVARIIPALWLFLVVILTFEAFTGTPVTLTEIAALGTFTRTYVGGYIGADPIPIRHLWSLNVEEHCYLILSLVALALRWRAAVVLLGFAGLTYVAIALHHHFGDGDYLLTTECAATFIMASAGYRLLQKPTVPSWTPVAALGAAVACYAGPWYLSVLFPPLLLAFTVNHLENAPSWFLRGLSARWLCWCGVVSYSVYLWQEPLYMAHFQPVWGISLSVVVGAASFYLFESPLRSWLNENWGRTPAPPAIGTVVSDSIRPSRPA